MKHRRLWILAVLVLVLLAALAAGYALIQRQLAAGKHRIEEFVHARYGLNCEMDGLDYAFPDGVRATRLRVSLREKPLFSASEATFRIRPIEYLKTRSLNARLLHSVDAAGVQVRIERTAEGEWLIPAPLSRRDGESTAGESSVPSAPPVRCSVRGLGLDLSTPRGALKKRYDGLDALFDTASGTGDLTLRGGDEKVNIRLRRVPERRVEIEAEALSLEPLLLFTSPVLPFDRLFLRGNAEIRESSPGRVTFAAAGSVFGKGTDQSLQIDLTAEGAGTPAGPEEVRGTMSLNGEAVHFSANSTDGRKPVLHLNAVFPDFSFERAVAAVPVSFRPNLPDLKVTGHLKGTFSATIATARPYRTTHRFSGEAMPLRVLALGPKVRIAELNRPFLHTFRTDDGRTISIRVGPDNRDFVPYADIPPDLVRAVMTAEDGGFFRHGGISVLQIIEATADNIRAGRVVRGASTITMQLAKNLYLGRERTLSRKFEELFITRALEQELSKQRILEIYLNIIEWGDGIYGLAPAARHYFQKDPADLTDLECAFLASIIARPKNRWKPDPLARLTSGWQQYLDLLLRKMAEKEIPQER
jgi:hypothetical protein